MDDVVIRPLRDSDSRDAMRVAAGCLAGLAAVSRSVSRWGPAFRRGVLDGAASVRRQAGGGRSLVAAREERIVGLGSVAAGRRHPHAFMRISVEPDSRRQGIGTALFGALTGGVAGPFLVREYLSDPATVSFYRRRGFVTGETATEGVIRPDSRESAVWIGAALSESPAGAQVVPLESSGFSKVDAARAVDDLYVRTHPHSPPTALDDETAVTRYVTGARTGSFHIAARRGRIVGAGYLVPSPFVDDDRVAHLELCGVRDAAEPDAAAITRHLVARLLAHAHSNGWSVEIEANSPNQTLESVAESIPGADLYRDLIILVSHYGT